MSRNKQRDMKGTVKKFCKENRLCVITFLALSILWVVIAMYMKYAPFGNNSLLMNDAIHQYYPLFGQYRDRILSGTGIFYSAGGGMGFNFYALWTYYLSSPLNLLILLFPASQIDSGMNFLIIFKIILSGTAFSYYMGRKYGKQNLSILPFAFGYAVSTFVIGYCYNIMWMDCLALFPVILAGLERLLEEKKWKQYTVALALCLWCSFYISFIICLFLVLWFLFYEHQTVKEFLKKGLLFAGCSLLSAGLSCVVLLPAYLGIVQTQSKSSIPSFNEWMGEFSDIFAGKEGGIFAFSKPMSLNNEVAYNVNLYCGVFVLALAVLYFMRKDITLMRKAKAAWFLILFNLSFNNQALNYIWHGFHYQVGIPNRFAFLMIFLLLLMAFEAFSHLHDYKRWQILSSGAVSLGVYGVLYFLEKNNITTNMLLCTLSFSLVYTVFFMLWKNEEKGLLKTVVLILMCLELSANAIAGSRKQVGVQADAFYRSKSDIQKIADALSYDEYRTELSNPTVKNEGLAYNLRGTSIFSSMANPNTIKLLHNIGFSTSSNAYSVSGSTPVINTLFGIKNYLIIEGDANRLDYRYKKEETQGEATRYENEQILPVAYLCKDDVQEWTAVNADFFQNQQELLKMMTGNEYEVYTEQKFKLVETNDVEVESLDEHQQFIYLAASGARNDHAVFEAVADEDEDLYLRLQAMYSGKTTILLNDEVIAYKDLSSSFYHIGNVEKGDKITVMIGIQQNSPTYGKISMAMYGYHQDAMDRVYEKLAQGAMKMTEWGEGYVKGTVKVTDPDTTLFTTIPYDKGWRILVDGEEKEVQTVKGGFLMMKLEQGEHKVEFSYSVPGLIAGGAVSLGSMFLFVAALWIGKKIRIRKDAKEERDVNESDETEDSVPKDEKRIPKESLSCSGVDVCDNDHKPNFSDAEPSED